MDLDRLKEELERLVKVMEVLRGPDGCPWDREQDYYSLQPYIIEEAYEVVEALQNKDLLHLKEELGDLLLQVVFQAQIGRENDDFDLADVFEVITEKLIRRHPHVFAEKEEKTLVEQKKLWEEIKKEETGELDGERPASILDRLNKAQPALKQAYEIQDKAAGVGFDWDNSADIIAKIEEELEEVKEASRSGQAELLEGELGDLLFAVVNLVRFYRKDPELALLRTVLKFKDRFMYIEERIREKGSSFAELTLEELDVFWEESKEGEKIEEN